MCFKSTSISYADLKCLIRAIFEDEHRLLEANAQKFPKCCSKQQQVRVRKNCGTLYRQLLNGCDLIMDDEK